jgi:hypothetical protein
VVRDRLFELIDKPKADHFLPPVPNLHPSPISAIISKCVRSSEWPINSTTALGLVVMRKEIR